MLHVQSRGNGKPLVLLHGFCENSTCFNALVPLLEKNYLVITPDLPGVGQSSYIENLSMEKMADEVQHTLVHMGIRDAVMLGHSMGGYVTLAYAKKYSHNLKGFGLLHSTANPDTDVRKIKREQALGVVSEKGHEFYIRQFIPPLFAPSFQNKETIDGLIEQGLHTSRNAIMSQIVAMRDRPSGRAFLEETDLPVLFLAGVQDSIIPFKDIIEQAASVKQGCIETLQHSAHMGMIEEPELFANAIHKFMGMCN